MAKAYKYKPIPIELFNKLDGKFIVSNDCWLWLGNINSNGYGVIGYQKKDYLAHRVMFASILGQIPARLTLDHLCRVRNCVNPEHLEPVSHKENCLRGDGPTARNARKTHCKYGHPFSGANLLKYRAHERKCRTCYFSYMKIYMRKRRALKKQ